MHSNGPFFSEARLAGYSKAQCNILLLHLLVPELVMHGSHNVWLLGEEHHTAGVHVQAMERMRRSACAVNQISHSLCMIWAIWAKIMRKRQS